MPALPIALLITLLLALIGERQRHEGFCSVKASTLTKQRMECFYPGAQMLLVHLQQHIRDYILTVTMKH